MSHHTDNANQFTEATKAKVVEVLKTVFDPEIPLNIYELGLVYDIAVDAGGGVHVKMTLTSPGCPVAGSLVAEVERKIAAVEGVGAAMVELVWDPPWSPARMSEAARLQLNMDLDDGPGFGKKDKFTKLGRIP